MLNIIKKIFGRGDNDSNYSDFYKWIKNGYCPKKLKLWIRDKDSKSAWKECTNPQWLLILAVRGGASTKQIALVLLKCVDFSLSYENYVNGDNHLNKFALTVRRFYNETATLDDVKRANQKFCYSYNDFNSPIYNILLKAVVAIEASKKSPGNFKWRCRFAIDSANLATLTVNDEKLCDIIRKTIPFKILAF